jgi:transcriptional regulator with XRE-family HTH domain
MRTTGLRNIRGHARTRWPRGTYMKVRNPQVLKGLIQQKGLSYADVGRNTERDRTYIYQLASGRRSTCLPQVAVRIAQILDVPVDLLFEPRMSPVTGQSVDSRKKIAA